MAEIQEGGGGGHKGGKKRAKKQKALFYPKKFFISAWTKAPGWKYPKNVDRPTDKIQIRDDLIKEKANKVIDFLKEKNVSMNIDVPGAYFNVQDKRKGRTKYHEDFKKPNQYDEWKKLCPPKYPGPQSYWKTDPVKFVAGKSKPVDNMKNDEAEEGKDKVYKMDRKKTDKRQYKPMKGHIF